MNINPNLLTGLVYAGVALVAFAAEQFHVIPVGASNVIIGLVAGAAYGEAHNIITANKLKASE